VTFYIWFFDKKHKHHHLAMIYFCLLVGVISALIGYLAISISIILALASFLFSCLAFVSIFYYIIDKRRNGS